ncbi:MAG: 50S ribosomal protein L3 N(5)-glutamine methyltransferase [Porticoccaceae bacterium]|nr:50S ribosomal protein L3 N(5)-glutamine methyltransferase [Porticoccaceae bacterium]
MTNNSDPYKQTNQPNAESLNVAQLLGEGEAMFIDHNLYFGHGTDSAWDEAVSILSYVLAFPPNADRSLLTTVLTGQQLEQIRSLFRRRVDERIPAPYITGQAWFCGLPFMVDQRVLIPRSPIAGLITNYFEPWLQSNPKRILDLCAGGGCIGISCAYGFDEAEVVLSDISADAIVVANINIDNHKLGKRVVAIQSDLFEGLKGRDFDLIISNPPYVDQADLDNMPEEFRHEPELALASGCDGLDFTRRLLQQAHEYLSEDGLLIVEVGNSGEALERAFPAVPFMWFEFAEGDSGVFMLTQAQLAEHREMFA